METLISITDVHKRFKDVHAVKGISLEIGRGEFVGLLGPNGAGKTTLMEMIEGIQFPDSGDIGIAGMKWAKHRRQLQHLLGISLQETHFIDRLRVDETLLTFGSFYGRGRERVEEILDIITLREKRKSFVKNLSGGQRQRLALGVALINNPAVLLLDEPTTGLDPNARREVWDILLQLRESHGMTLVLTTHYMEEAHHLCERIVIMDKGEVLADGTLEALVAGTEGHERIEFALETTPESGIALPQLERTPEFDDLTDRWNVTVKELGTALPKFVEDIAAQGLKLRSVECRKVTLDDIFVSLTGRKLSDDT